MKRTIVSYILLMFVSSSTLYSSIFEDISAELTPPACSVVIEPGFTKISTSYHNNPNPIYRSVRVRFYSANLHANSFLLITSSEDGACQKLDAESMSQWRKLSAAFNGLEVKIELYKHYQDPTPSFTVGRLEANSIANTGAALCKNYTADDDTNRTPSLYPEVGRLRAKVDTTSPTESGGTGWISSNGTLIGPGHGVKTTYYTQYMEFNVPASDADGALNHPSPDDQYAIDYSTIQRQDNGTGFDWAIFRVFRNSNTGLLPHEKQNSFLRVIKDGIPSSGTKVGFGLDVYPPGTAGGGNSSHNTQQSTPFTNIRFINPPSSRIDFEGVVDGKDSGSPIIHNSNGAAFGIVTNCIPKSATAFTNTSLENSLNNIFGNNVTYVDTDHPSTTKEGIITRPYSTISTGVQNASSNDFLLVTKGYYDEPITINKALTINAPVGSVTIGTSGSSSKALPDSKDRNVLNQEEIPKKFSLSQNYPNPFNPETTINYTLPVDGKVSLKVFNSIGQEVLTLVDGEKKAGNYIARLNASSLSSGVYFYILKVGEKSLVKSMTIIK